MNTLAVQINNVKYTTRDRAVTFRFDFVQMPDTSWRIYIKDQPGYNGRPDGSHASHRLSDERGRFICWEPAPRSLDEAKGVARAWADATHDYIQTGQFPPPGPARHVPDLSTSATWEFRNHVGSIPERRAEQPRPAPPPPAYPQAPMQVSPPRPSGLRGLFPRRNR
jgi:hypothetical protein